MIDIHQLVKDSKLNSLDFTLSLLPDKRIHNHNFKYLLNKLILTMVIAMMSGYTNFRAFADYAKINPYVCGSPSKSTFHRVSDILDYRLLAIILRDWMIELLKLNG